MNGRYRGLWSVPASTARSFIAAGSVAGHRPVSRRVVIVRRAACCWAGEKAQWPTDST
ncbi:hypothetical protein [Pseudonocardia adelaidensis]|uniref:hypothetical protein n=1 Tax=Pseudonocardia adelaidensis TaxID=648754 RepID=UPI0031EB65D5